MKIPPTLITSNPELVKEFWAAWHGKVIVKQLKLRPIINEAVFTSRLTAKDIEGIDSVRLSPAIFQAEIPKAHELRIAMFGHESFAIAIDSQGDPETIVDWRMKPDNVSMTPATLPDELVRRLRSLLDEFHLAHGVFDLIRTPESEYIFLELNPNGQWHFMEKAADGSLAEAMARLLAGRVTSAIA
jgi:glutathione synthase/RimK-type ligase-like ATP-grasp enzyme